MDFKHEAKQKVYLEIETKVSLGNLTWETRREKLQIKIQITTRFYLKK